MGQMIPKRPKPNHELLRSRIAKHLSADALARQTGLSAKTIRAIEAGRVRRPHVDTKGRLAEALEKDILVLFPIDREARE